MRGPDWCSEWAGRCYGICNSLPLLMTGRFLPQVSRLADRATGGYGSGVNCISLGWY